MEHWIGYVLDLRIRSRSSSPATSREMRGAGDPAVIAAVAFAPQVLLLLGTLLLRLAVCSAPLTTSCRLVAPLCG